MNHKDTKTLRKIIEGYLVKEDKVSILVLIRFINFVSLCLRGENNILAGGEL
jgi:hypothetical protein